MGYLVLIFQTSLILLLRLIILSTKNKVRLVFMLVDVKRGIILRDRLTDPKKALSFIKDASKIRRIIKKSEKIYN